MWILLRLVAAAIAGLLKFHLRRTFGGKPQWAGTLRWYLQQEKHKGSVVATCFGIDCRHTIFFRLSRETPLDGFFKAVGFSREIQTGDEEFDAEIYVSCDHPALAPVLEADVDLRIAIRKLFRSGVKAIRLDGARLWARRAGDVPPEETELAALVRLRDALQAVPEDQLVLLRDGFFWRALVVESIAWSIAFYGLPGFVEIATRSHPQYLDWVPVIKTGLLYSPGVFAALFGLSWFVLRTSSRAHRVLTESAIVLLLGVPLSTIQAVSDLNIALDRTTPVVWTPVVQDAYTRTKKTKSGYRTDYYVRLALKREELGRLPPDIEVSPQIHRASRRGSRLTITLGNGALGIPWVQGIRAAR